MSFLGHEHLTALLDHYGYGLLAALVCLEAIGLPLPGESAILAAALYAASTHRLNIVAVVAIAALAATLGSTIGYVIGRAIGARLLSRYGHYVGLNEERVTIGRYLFARHGGKVVLFGRFVAFLRSVAALLAGVTRMEWPRFMAANAAGAVPWAALYGFGAYFLGEEAKRIAGPAALVIGAVAVAAVVTAIIVTRRQERRLVALAEQDLDRS